MSTDQIAKVVGLGSRKAVQYHLVKIREEWKENTLRAFSDLRAEQLAELDRLYMEAILAWERSKTDKTTRVNKAKGPAGSGASPTSAEAATRTEEQSGNAAFLDLALKIAERKAKLLGLDAPTRIETSGPGGGPLQFALRAEPKAVEERIAELDARWVPADPALTGQIASMRSGPVTIDAEVLGPSDPGPGPDLSDAAAEAPGPGPGPAGPSSQDLGPGPYASAPGPGSPSAPAGASDPAPLPLPEGPPDRDPLERRPGSDPPRSPSDNLRENSRGPISEGENFSAPTEKTGAPAEP